jgi:hypothetical protein
MQIRKTCYDAPLKRSQTASYKAPQRFGIQSYHFLLGNLGHRMGHRGEGGCYSTNCCGRKSSACSHSGYAFPKKIDAAGNKDFETLQHFVTLRNEMGILMMEVML